MTTFVSTGSFKSVAAVPFFVPLSQKIDRFDLVNLTRSGITSGGVTGVITSTRIVEAKYTDYTPVGWAQVYQNGTVSNNGAPMSNGFLSTNGFTLINASTTFPAAIPIASFVPGTTTTFTTTGTQNFSVGDTVRIYGMTTAPELGGLAMTVTAVSNSGNTFTTLLNSSNSLTSVGSVVKIGAAGLPLSSLYYPQNRVIAAITQANPMVVTTLVAQTYQIGDVVRFQIPSVYGMTQLNSPNSGLPFQATVSSVNNAVGTQTVTFANVNSTGFTAFAFPGTASATVASFPASFPQMIPQGEGNTNNFVGVSPSPLPYANQDILGFATQNQGAYGMLIGAGDGTLAATTGGILGSTTDVWSWTAYTSSQTFP